MQTRTRRSLSSLSKARQEELASRTLVLRIVPERAKGVSRTLEMLASQTLAKLHDCIRREFELDDDHQYAFFMSGRAWDTSTCHRGPDKSAAKVSLQLAGCKPGKEFLYIFNFGDGLAHRIRVESQGTRELGVSYPRTVAAVGKVPPQGSDVRKSKDDAPQMDADLRALAEEAIVAIREQQERLSQHRCPTPGCKGQHGPVDPAFLACRLPLERRLREALLQHPSQLFALDAHCDYALIAWVSQVIFDLAESARPDEALAMFDAWTAFAEGEENAFGNRVKLLLLAGRNDEAKAEAERRLARTPDEPYALRVLACVHGHCKEWEQAEALYRRAYRAAGHGTDLQQAFDTGSDLVNVLHERGKTVEAEALQAKLQEQVDRANEGYNWVDEDDDDPSEAPRPVIAPPKIGRNDPCPCHSGKKYKKCCGE